MFKRKPQAVGDILSRLMRDEGLETPLLQKRIIDSWDELTGSVGARYTQEKYIKNQTLFVKIQNPALRSNLSMRRSELVKMLNDKVGAYVISDIRFY